MVPVIIVFRGRQNVGMVKGFGGRVKSVYRFHPAVAAEIPEAAIEALAKNPLIKVVVPDLEIELVQTTPWGVERIGAPTVHNLGNKGAGINVAILDSGIDTDHPDLSYVAGYDFGDDDTDPEDRDGHGTHVAGTVAALDNTAGVVGVAPDANLYILKVFSDDGSGYYSDTVEAFEWCIQTHMDVDPGNDIQIISMSFGSNVVYGDPGIEPWINQAYDLGILLVGAAGNEGNSPGRGDNVIYPARYENVIAVAATGESDERAKWSSTGPSVELSAPGVSILSAYLGGGYAYASGTSMACPHVSGTAALILGSDEGAWASLGYTDGDGDWTNSEVREVLAMTADDLGSTGRDTKYGYGLVDADEVPPVPPVPDTTPPTTIYNLAATTEAYPDILLEWTPATDDVGIDHYNIYRSTTSTIDKAADLLATAAETATSFTDSTGTEETTYYYAVCAEDAAGNEAGLSNIAEATVPPVPSNNIHVASIDMSLGGRTAGRNRFVLAIATITIMNSDGNLVDGATVYGHWEGATIDSDTGMTDASGQVSLKSDSVKNPPSGTTFTFVVDDVALIGWPYDPSANSETSDSVMTP